MSTDEQAFLDLAKETQRLAKIIEEQNEMIGGLMFLVNAQHTMTRIHHRRLDALEKRAGMDLEALMKAEDLPPLGLQPEDVPELFKITEGLEKLSTEAHKRMKEHKP